MGLFLIVLMCVATVLLIRNMNKRIRRLPDSFPVANERDRVVGLARDASGAERSDASVAADVEADRSVPAAATEEPEVAAVGDEQSGAGPRGGAERA
ncbi:hypothetical protein QLQ12_07065 [Actinoplanes sp. NEAU-A12]|uniref:Secreted protein n=1 Tax=Actinoplanes sandaracinus TaxID=3045177 RepID=A0ABT6WF62_9ACTN|nr:hypothetical protein [Actinoplanes sandaracinus]